MNQKYCNKLMVQMFLKHIERSQIVKKKMEYLYATTNFHYQVNWRINFTISSWEDWSSLHRFAVKELVFTKACVWFQFAPYFCHFGSMLVWFNRCLFKCNFYNIYFRTESSQRRKLLKSMMCLLAVRPRILARHWQDMTSFRVLEN